MLIFIYLFVGNIKRAWAGTHHQRTRFLRQYSTDEKRRKRALGDVTSGTCRHRWRNHYESWRPGYKLDTSSVHEAGQQRRVSLAGRSHTRSYSAAGRPTTVEPGRIQGFETLWRCVYDSRWLQTCEVAISLMSLKHNENFTTVYRAFAPTAQQMVNTLLMLRYYR